MIYSLIEKAKEREKSVVIHSGGNSVFVKLGKVKVLDSGQKITE